MKCSTQGYDAKGDVCPPLITAQHHPRHATCNMQHAADHNTKQNLLVNGSQQQVTPQHTHSCMNTQCPSSTTSRPLPQPGRFHTHGGSTCAGSLLMHMLAHMFQVTHSGSASPDSRMPTPQVRNIPSFASLRHHLICLARSRLTRRQQLTATPMPVTGFTASGGGRTPASGRERSRLPSRP